MSEFEVYKKYFDSDKMEELTNSVDGLLWLILKSITRKEYLNNFCNEQKIKLSSKTLSDQAEELYQVLFLNKKNSLIELKKFIKNNIKSLSIEDEENIASELYKIKNFNWGGDYTNALDKFLIDRYVKIYKSYDDICKKLDMEIPTAVNGYVICSWYNHWSTILIENIFKKHDKVLPAIGNVKKIDFFIEDIPFDLKTTYVPINFIDNERKKAGLRSEIAELKYLAKTYAIYYNKNNKDKDIRHEIIEKIQESVDLKCKEHFNQMIIFRGRLIEDCMKNPIRLIKNLYENQGEMRFDASNRLFIILIDINDFESSWKLKRNPSLLRKNIDMYLEKFDANKINKMKINFTHKAKVGEFSAISDIIFVTKN